MIDALVAHAPLRTAEPRAAAAVGPRVHADPGSRVFAALAVSYVVLGLVLLPAYRYQLNPDGVAYLTIAGHYVDGDWSETVNGLWSPMYSWLLAPLLAAGADPLLAARGLNLASGLAALAALWVLSGRFTDRVRLRAVATGAVLPALLAWSFSVVTPDLLLVAVLLAYLHVVTSPRFGADVRYALVAGALGGVAYLTKGYAFPFFLVHFVGYARWRKTRLRHALAGLGCFTAISAPWVTLISLKYGYLTQSTTMAYNWKLMGPAYRGQHPTYRPGLLDPTSPHATSAWQDPTTLPMSSWSPVAHPWYFARLVVGNLTDIVVTLERFCALTAVIVVVGALIRGTDRERHLLRLTGFTLALTVGGYATVKLEPRYIWLAAPLLALAAVVILAAAQRDRRVTRTGAVLAALVLLGSFWLPAARDLVTQRGTGAPNAATATALRHAVPAIAGASVASDSQPRASLYVSYLVTARYYGLALTAPDAAEAQLHAKGVAYFLSWGPADRRPAYLRAAPVVFVDPARGLTVYRLTPS